MTQIPETLILKNTIVKPQEFLILLFYPLLVYLFLSQTLDQNVPILLLLPLVPVTIWIFLKLLKRLRNRLPRIIIDRRGIELCENGQFYEWAKVEYAFIKRHVEGSGRYARSIDYFHLVSNGQETTLNISDIRFDRKLVKAIIEQYSGRSIADPSNKFRDEVAALLQDKRYVNKIVHRFKKFKIRQSLIALFSLLVPVGLSIYFQVTTEYWFCIGLGFLTTIFLTLFVSRLSERAFRTTDYISNLTDTEFNSIARKYEIKYSRKAFIGILIFLLIANIGIFVISYLAIAP